MSETAKPASISGQQPARTSPSAPEPPFFRGALSEWPADICDRIVESGDACDDPAAYLIEWQQRPGDGGTVPLSGCCERHVSGVDRKQVVRMCTHPNPAGNNGADRA